MPPLSANPDNTPIPYERWQAVAQPLLRRHGLFFRKHRQVMATRANPGDVVDTITAAGNETRNVVTDGDYIIENQTAARERYIISADNLQSRYQPVGIVDEGGGLYRATGFIAAMGADRMAAALGISGDVLTFMAPWGSAQTIRYTDFVVTPWPTQTEVYGVAATEFAQTYVPVDDSSAGVSPSR